jgi:DNA mismatch repair protein MutS2
MIYPQDFETKTGFDRIRLILSEYCQSPMGQQLVSALKFLDNPAEIKYRIATTYEFQQILRFEENFPSGYYFDISGSLSKIRIEGSFPEVYEVFNLKRSLETVKAVVGFFRRKEANDYPVLKSFCTDIKVYPYVIDAADRILDKEGNVRDSASPRLKEIRNNISQKSIQATRKLNSILKQAQSDGLVEPDTVASVRNGRGVIPVNAFDKRKLKGLIHDQSASGKTVFIEPAEIVEINNEIVELEYEERREIVRILTSFADDIRPYIEDLLIANGFLGEIDFIRAKALLGNQLGSISPAVAEKPGLLWRNTVHPLLFLTFQKMKDRKVVPLNITLEDKNRIILISGPNAGGKSVCLKSVGLIQYMFQCGLTIPVGEGSESGIFSDIFIDIGDEQSIENDLSTYSSHLINMKFFVRNASSSTLVLIDEFGTGTEPMLGGAIAESILTELNNALCYGVITTHYTNLKHFASMADGIINGAMLFDNHLMQPLFQLSIGKPGSSFAFEIARKIGLPEEILKRAGEKAGVKNINYDRNLKDIARDKRYWETKRQKIRQHEKRLEELIEKYETELSGMKNLRKEIILKAKNEAESILDQTNSVIENTIRQIRESQAEKERTREARRDLDDFKQYVSDEIKPEETGSEEKAEKLAVIAKRLRPKKEEKNYSITSDAGKPLLPGDAVRVTETNAAGEIIEIKGTMARIETGTIIISIPVDKLERITRAELRKNLRTETIVRQVDPVITERKLNFKPEIDIRGVRGDEAIEMVRDFIDNALMVQHRNLRILHGKGNGILRQLVREYLKTVNIVKSFRDENVDLGGSGITVVEMDI